MGKVGEGKAQSNRPTIRPQRFHLSFSDRRDHERTQRSRKANEPPPTAHKGDEHACKEQSEPTKTFAEPLFPESRTGPSIPLACDNRQPHYDHYSAAILLSSKALIEAGVDAISLSQATSPGPVVSLGFGRHSGPSRLAWGS